MVLHNLLPFICFQRMRLTQDTTVNYEDLKLYSLIAGVTSRISAGQVPERLDGNGKQNWHYL